MTSRYAAFSQAGREVEHPIAVSSWDRHVRVPVKSVFDWIVVCASEASYRPCSEDYPQVELKGARIPIGPWA